MATIKLTQDFREVFLQLLNSEKISFSVVPGGGQAVQ